MTNTTNRAGTRSSTLISVFATREQAECALEKLKAAGLTEQQYGVVMRQPKDSGESDMTTGEKAVHAGKTTAAGATIGGVIGALVGAAGALLIPGIGPVLAGGLIASALGGAAVGVAAGGLAGALDGLSIPEDEARFAEQEFQQGRIILTVQAGMLDARPILAECGGYDIHSKPVGHEGNVANMAHPEPNKTE